MRPKISVFVKDNVIQECQSMNHALSQAPISSAACFPINSFDSQVDVIRSPRPEATVTHTSIHFSVSLLFAHVCFSLQPYGWVSPSEKVGLIITTSHTCSPDDSPQHCGERGASGLKTKEKWWCTKVCATRSLNVVWNQVRKDSSFDFIDFLFFYYTVKTRNL